MRFRLAYVLVAAALVAVVGCATSPPSTPEAEGKPTATGLPSTWTPTREVVSTDTPIPPKETATPKPTATAIPPTFTPIPPTATPLPATDTVCAAGCDFTTLQAAIDDPATADGAILEVMDAVHTEAGIVVAKDVTIRGLGAGNTIVQASETVDGAHDRVLAVDGGTSVVLERMVIRHGRPSEDICGGGILNDGTLTLRECVVRDNMANGGGGVCSRGGDAVLTVINSTIRDNTAGATVAGGLACGNGGGIRTGSGKLTLISSAVVGNATATGRGRGGGIHIGCGGRAVFTNTTISGNTASPQGDKAISRKKQGHGGGVNLHGALRLVNCTISDNRAIGRGGGVYVRRGRMDFVNTIIANNAGQGGNCVALDPDANELSGSLGTNRHNLVADGTCDPAYAEAPLLDPLADNGGDTLTHALLPGSPAIDAVPAISCTVPTDQRGALRPVVQTSAETPCDIGAFEVQGQLSALPRPEALWSGGAIISVDTVDQVECLRTLSGHSDRVKALAFSGDGAHVASSSRDRTIRLWDLQSGQAVHTFSTSKVNLNGIAFSPDGNLLASADAIWDVESGQVVHTLEWRGSAPGVVAFSPDGSTLAVALESRPIRVLDVASGQEVRTFQVQADDAPFADGVVFSIEFSPDGALLAAGVHGGVVRLWDVASGQNVGAFEHGGEDDDVHDVAFSPDGRVLASGGNDCTARLWDVASGQAMHILRPRDGLYGVAFSPDGAVVATAGCDRTVGLWDVESGRMLRRLPHADEVMTVAFSLDGTLLTSGGYDNAVYLWGIR